MEDHMKKICIPLADGFEEIEAVTLVDVLRRAGFTVKTCALQSLQARGSHDITVVADMTIDQALDREWDLVVLPGGMPGAGSFWKRRPRQAVMLGRSVPHPLL
jgi:4-methyl-5(b-hydroxyethyl)-thiazole monophosphate biosynthesis